MKRCMGSLKVLDTPAGPVGVVPTDCLRCARRGAAGTPMPAPAFDGDDCPARVERASVAERDE